MLIYLLILKNLLKMDSILDTIKDAQEDCQAPLSFGGVIGLVVAFCVAGLVWSILNIISVNRIDVERGVDG